MTVEQLARAVGVWVGTGWTAGQGCMVGPVCGAELWCVSVTPEQNPASWTNAAVDGSTALLALLVHARGLGDEDDRTALKVDMGPCPACVGTCRVAHAGLGGPDKPCEVCMTLPPTSNWGKPTGRDVRPLVRVLLDSMPCGRCSSDKWDGEGAGRFGPRWRESCSACGGARRGNGDPASRERLAVKADELSNAGDPLGELLAAFLGGECRACEGDGYRPTRTVRTPSGGTAKIDVATCPDCNGRGTMLGALAPALEEMAAEEWRARTVDCVACDGAGLMVDGIPVARSALAFYEDVDRCAACDGLGRIVPRGTEP